MLLNFAPETQCTPSRSALMTGRYSIRSGNQTVALAGSQGGLVKWERTLGDVFSEAGYATSIVGKWHIGDSEGRRVGYPIEADSPSPAPDRRWSKIFHGGGAVPHCAVRNGYVFFAPVTRHLFKASTAPFRAAILQFTAAIAPFLVQEPISKNPSPAGKWYLQFIVILW